MAKKRLLKTDFAQFAGVPASSAKVVRYLHGCRQDVLPVNILPKLLADKPLLETPANAIFRHLRDSEKIYELFAPMYFGKQVGSIPELLLSNDVVIDLAYIPEANILTSFPEFAGKVVLNLSSILKSTKTDRSFSYEFQVNDLNVLHSLYVKGALVISYHDSDGWLNPSLGLFLVKSYSMTLSGIIAKLYNLTLAEQLTIAAAFAMYMCQMLDKEGADEVSPMLFQRCTFLGNTTTLNELMSAMSDKTKGGLDITKLCALVAELGPDRMKNFNGEIFYRIIRNLCNDTITSLLAVEFPPYWVHQLIVAMSNGKTKLFFELKANRLQEETKRFLYELDTSSSFIGDLPSTGKSRL